MGFRMIGSSLFMLLLFTSDRFVGSNGLCSVAYADARVRS